MKRIFLLVSFVAQCVLAFSALIKWAMALRDIGTPAGWMQILWIAAFSVFFDNASQVLERLNREKAIAEHMAMRNRGEV